MSGKNENTNNEQNEQTETTNIPGSIEFTTSGDSSTSGNDGSDQGFESVSRNTSENTSPINTTFVPMPENGLPALSQMTGLSVDELYELNKDLLQNKLSYTVGQMVRIPS
jgi:hypothetical protein